MWLLWNEKYSWKHQSKNILQWYYYNHTEHVLSFFVCYFMLVLNVSKTWSIHLQYYSNLVVIYYSQEPSPQIIWTWTVLQRVVEMALHTCLWKCDDKGPIIYKLKMMFLRKAAITFKPITYSFKKANNELLTCACQIFLQTTFPLPRLCTTTYLLMALATPFVPEKWQQR